MKIRVRYFASVREAVGISEESIVLPDRVKTLDDLRGYLMERGTIWREALAEGNGLRMACQLKMAAPDTPLTEGNEVAFFPPVTGG